MYDFCVVYIDFLDLQYFIVILAFQDDKKSYIS